MTNTIIILIGIAALILTVGFIVLCAVIAAGRKPDYDAFTDAGHCHHCHSPQPALFAADKHWRCPQCGKQVPNGTRILCQICGHHLDGPLHAHEALHTRYGLSSPVRGAPKCPDWQQHRKPNYIPRPQLQTEPQTV